MTKKLLVILPISLALAVAGAYFYANHRVKSLVDMRIEAFLENGDYRELNYEAVSLEMNGDILLQNLHVIDITGNEYVLENIRISNFDFMNPIPRHLDMTATGMRLPSGIPLFGMSPNRAFNAYVDSIMDEDYLPLAINYRYVYEPQNSFQLDSSFSVELPGSFQLTSDSVMRNVALEQFNTGTPAPNANPVQYSLLVQDADVPTASVALQDLGLVNAMMAIQGDALGMSGDDFRQQLLAQLQTAALFVPQQLQSIAQQLLINFADFLEGDATIRFTINPEYGGNVQQLQGEVVGAFYIGDFARIVELLNLEIETSR